MSLGEKSLPQLPVENHWSRETPTLHRTKRAAEDLEKGQPGR